MNFECVNLGQTVIKYQVPYDIFLSINNIYQTYINNLPSANKTLVGKIKKEHSIYYNGDDETKIKKHNFITLDIFKWFETIYEHYLNFNQIHNYKIHINSIWINEMREHEYNPAHVHRGSLLTGLSSVIILSLPKSYGEEYSAPNKPQNGRLQLFGSSSGQFAKVDYQPPMNIGDFYVFPYDMRHCVYPFNGTNETRRTLAANCDVQYDSVENRGVI